MNDVPEAATEYEELMRSSQRRMPWYRRLSSRVGLQGKLIIAFIAMLAVGLESLCLLYVQQSEGRLTDIMGEEARQLVYTLALAGKPAMEAGNRDELRHIGQDLLKTRNIVFVAFFDGDYKPIAAAHRDPDFLATELVPSNQQMQSLMQVHRHNSPLFGDFLEVRAPMLGVAGGAESSGPRLLGYVSVGISVAQEQAQVKRMYYWAACLGGIIVLLSLPVAYLLIRRIFYPIRQLVDATRQIIGGDLETHVAVDRPDIIGMLARAFNEMVKTVRRQQQSLEKANRQLERANRDLEGKVQQRTSQLEAANSRLSGEIAEKEDFLRAVSHDLSAPLRNISGMASMLLMKHRDKFDEDIIHRLERIQKNVEVETDLIGELLELSRIKTRRQTMAEVDIGQLVREIGEMFENDLKSRRIALLIDTPLPTLKCEKARIRQLFQNLIDNAIKYMGEGITREIRVGCLPGANETEFYVRDTGLGIDPEDIDKVFYVFRRGKNPAARNVTGKGVGLASVKSIVETYNGSIWVESQLGQGSTFRFTINGRFVASSGSGSAPEQDEGPALAPSQAAGAPQEALC